MTSQAPLLEERQASSSNLRLEPVNSPSKGRGSGWQPFASPVCVCGPHPAEKLFTWQLAFCVVYAFTLLWLNCCVQVYVQRRSKVFLEIPAKYNVSAEDRDKLNTLPDLGFDVIPFSSNAHLADQIVYAMMGVTVLRFALTGMRATLLRRLLFTLGTLVRDER